MRGNGGIWWLAKPRVTASPSPKGVPPQAPPKEGMCLAGYGMLGVGEMEGWRIGLKGCLFILNGQMFRGQKYALSHADHLSLNS